MTTDLIRSAHRSAPPVPTPRLFPWVVLLLALCLSAPIVLAQAGTVTTHRKIASLQGGFDGLLADGDAFGSAVVVVGDVDGDGVDDLVVGADQNGDGGTSRGAVWVLFLNVDGTVRAHQKISDTEGSFTGTLNDSDSFGNAVASLGDFNADGIMDLVVGASGDDDGGSERGAVWVLFLDASPLALAVTVAPLDGPGGSAAPEPVAIPADGQTEVHYAGALSNASPDPLTLDGWPVITMPDESMIVRRPTVYTVPAGTSVGYSGAFVGFPVLRPLGSRGLALPSSHEEVQVHRDPDHRRPPPSGARREAPRHLP